MKEPTDSGIGAAGFSGLLGLGGVKRHLMTALHDGLVSHAYIMEGAQGIGKRTLARAFVRALLCQEPLQRTEPDGSCFFDSCGHCDNCHLIDTGNHPDVKYIRPLPDKKGIVVDQIRDEVVGDMSVRPYRNSYKIYVIEQADTMNAASQNALLKTIEEPPAYGIILLLAEHADAFLPTILSRCVRISLPPLSSPLLRQALVGSGIDEDRALTLSAYAQGALGQALALSRDEDFAALRSALYDFLAEIPACTPYEVLTKGGQLFEEYKGSLPALLSLMTLWFRDVGVYLETKSEDRLLCRDYTSDLAACASHYTSASVIRATDAIQETASRLNNNVNMALAVDILMIRIR